MNISLENAWLIIVLMAAITYLTRSLPFLLSDRTKIFKWLSSENSLLSALGPSLLVSIAAVTIAPLLSEGFNSGGGALPATCIGLFTTILAMKYSDNVGLAVICGMFFYAMFRGF
ncbi:MAG: AzlD domain-containing protein [Betaproteobacteria bacterium]|nr:AzlD domain-containing protein [Betaproteobacteria bacterium]